jgi:hypothetical protein
MTLMKNHFLPMSANSACAQASVPALVMTG